MDVFSRTFLPATAETALPIAVVSRHMPVLRRYVRETESTVLVTACHRPGHPVEGSCLLVLTDRTLVVTCESRLTRRVRLHLAADVSLVRDVTWSVDARHRSMELAATVPGRVRERIWIPARDVRRVQLLDAALRRVFRRGAPGGAGRRAVTHRPEWSQGLATTPGR